MAAVVVAAVPAVAAVVLAAPVVRAAKPGQRTTWGRTLGFAVMPGADTWATKPPALTPDGRLFMYTGDMARPVPGPPVASSGS